MNVSSEAGSEGDGEFGLEVANLKIKIVRNFHLKNLRETDHSVGVNTGNSESKPIHEPSDETRPIGRDLIDNLMRILLMICERSRKTD